MAKPVLFVCVEKNKTIMYNILDISRYTTNTKGGAAVNKILKILTAFIFAAVMAVSSAVTANAAEQSEVDFGVTFGWDGALYTVKCQPQSAILKSDWYFEKPDYLQKTNEENILHLILPYDAAAAQLSAAVGEEQNIYLNGAKTADGDILSLADGTQHTLSADGKNYILKISYGSDIPAVYIHTESGNMDNIYANKANKESAYISVTDGGKTLCDVELDFIKGRGNFTWDAVPKKSFSIKFMEETDLFGMGGSKSYALLANHVDLTMNRNSLIYSFADSIGLEFTPQSQYVDLYVNDRYMGLYSLTEKVEIGESRVDIANLEQQTIDLNPYDPVQKADLAGDRSDTSAYTPGSYKWVDVKNNPEDITGGYIIELELNERYYGETSGFVSGYGQTVVVSSPEHASKAQVEYISDYYQQFEDAVMSEDGCNSLGKHYSEYIDVDSVVKMHLIHEYAKNLDAAITSFYFYKDIGGKLVAAPLWDMDSGFGRFFERYGVDFNSPEDLWVSGGRMVGTLVENKHTILALLWKHADYREAVYNEWHTVFAPQTEKLVSDFEGLNSSVKKSILNDRQMWLGGNLTEESIERWCEESNSFLKDFIRQRAEYLSATYSADKLRVEYAANGGWHFTLDGSLYSKGETAVVMNNGFRYDGADFIGWNTAADGSGIEYQPGDTIDVEENITLHAQWNLHPVAEQPVQEGGIIGLIKRIINRILG